MDNKRNMVAQRIVQKDLSVKVIFHRKKWPTISRKEFWDQQNRTPVKERLQNRFKVVSNEPSPQ